MSSFGEELKNLAEARGLTSQSQLAKAAGVSQQMVAALYLDQRPNVSAAIVYKLCRALAVSCQHFEPYLSPVSEDEEAAAVVPKPKRGRPKKNNAEKDV